MKRLALNSSKGLTLITTLVYIALLALIIIVLTRLTAGLVHANAQARLAGEVVDSAQNALAAITSEIQQSSAVYTPTSVFNSNIGQLSLVTTHNLPTDETSTYIDFYVDDEHVYVKRDGSTTQLVTSARVKVTQLQFTHLNPTSAHPAIRITATFTADVPDTALQTQTEITLHRTVSLRAYE